MGPALFERDKVFSFALWRCKERGGTLWDGGCGLGG